MSGNQVVQREKRFEVGVSKDFDVVVSRGESDETLYFADLMDFSRSGLKFCLPFNARFDEMLRIRLTFKNSELQYFGLGRVRHIRNTETNRWVVGCSIDPNLPDDLINHLAEVTHQERRKNPRVEVYANGFLSRQGKLEETPADLQNISKGGFCLFVDEAPETGSQVNFTIENRYGFQEQIDARIRWQKAHEAGFLVGLSFVDDESYERLVSCLDMPTARNEIDFSDIVDWKIVVCALIAMLMPSVSYVLLGASLGSSNTDVSQAGNRRGVEIQRVANPTKVNSAKIEKKKTVERTQTELKKIPKDDPGKTVKPTRSGQSKPDKQPVKKTGPVKKKPKSSMRQPSSKQQPEQLATINPPTELTSSQTTKPRRLRMAPTAGELEEPTAVIETSNTTSRLKITTRQIKATTRRVRNNDGIDVPYELINEEFLP